MSAGHRQALFAWLTLLLLAVAEIGCGFRHFDRSLRPLLLLPAFAMVAVVGLMFMRVWHGIAPARGFALAGLLWLLLLLGLGTMDPLTRAVYPVSTQTDASQQTTHLREQYDGTAHSMQPQILGCRSAWAGTCGQGAQS